MKTVAIQLSGILAIALLAVLPAIAAATSPRQQVLAYKILGDNVYYGDIYGDLSGMTKIDGADAASFVSLPKGDTTDVYAKDRARVYYKGGVLSGANTQSFEVLMRGFARDSHAAYSEGQKMQGIDGSTFRYLQHGYFKDASAVYYLSPSFSKIQADAATFRVDGGFGVDASDVFCYGKPIPGAQGSRFTLVRPADTELFNGAQIKQQPVGKDAHLVYTCWPPERNILSGATPTNFVMLDDNYGKDANHVWFLGDLTDIDPYTIEFLPFNFLRDKNGIHEYYGGEKVRGSSDVDVASLKILDRQWWKDKNSAYYFTNFEIEKIPGADVSSFAAIRRKCSGTNYDFFAMDSTYYYYASNGVQKVRKDAYPTCQDTQSPVNTDHGIIGKQPVAPLPTSQCPQITRTLRVGNRGGDVTTLQKFLITINLLSDDSVTGYFGLRTQAAVQSWQKAKNIVSYGSPLTTGFGGTGPKTRAALARCN